MIIKPVTITVSEHHLKAAMNALSYRLTKMQPNTPGYRNADYALDAFYEAFVAALKAKEKAATAEYDKYAKERAIQAYLDTEQLKKQEKAT
jgi:hypothetical protein